VGFDVADGRMAGLQLKALCGVIFLEAVQN